MEVLYVNDMDYQVVKLLGKGGYSYLVMRDGKMYVLKKIHHEPCSYYSFGNKLESELGDYVRLRSAGLKLPELFAFDRDREHILKEYIDGKTAFELVKENAVRDSHLKQMHETSETLRSAGLNIDWFPTNFVDRNGELWYIDYECNEYSYEWSFETLGIKYWSATPAFIEFCEENG